uniref:Putative secreted protein n=1 Tax=Ixodes scapularis TaxID=6945 RepID=A0A4D5RXW6_IXOSC
MYIFGHSFCNYLCLIIFLVNEKHSVLAAEWFYILNLFDGRSGPVLRTKYHGVIAFSSSLSGKKWFVTLGDFERAFGKFPPKGTVGANSLTSASCKLCVESSDCSTVY